MALDGLAIRGMPSRPVIVVIPCPADGCKPDEFDGEWLPRRCPDCGVVAVVGHGRRFRPACDALHDRIRVRRGFCNHCHGTLTALPAWCVPRAPYSRPAREQALTRIAGGRTLEQAAPDCLDPDRIADPSTIRRWAWRRIESLLVCAAAGWTALFCAPTILAWDFRAAARILIVEHASP